jgi:hypothetical protein
MWDIKSVNILYVDNKLYFGRFLYENYIKKNTMFAIWYMIGVLFCIRGCYINPRVYKIKNKYDAKN